MHNYTDEENPVHFESDTNRFEALIQGKFPNCTDKGNVKFLCPQ